MHIHIHFSGDSFSIHSMQLTHQIKWFISFIVFHSIVSLFFLCWFGRLLSISRFIFIAFRFWFFHIFFPLYSATTAAINRMMFGLFLFSVSFRMLSYFNQAILSYLCDHATEHVTHDEKKIDQNSMYASAVCVLCSFGDFAYLFISLLYELLTTNFMRINSKWRWQNYKSLQTVDVHRFSSLFVQYRQKYHLIKWFKLNRWPEYL